MDSRVVPYLALAPPFIAVTLQLAMWSAIAPYSWFLFFPAVFISSWIGGLRPGLIATAVSASLAWFFFVEPRYVMVKGQVNSLSTLAVFVVMGVLFSVFHERLRVANARTAVALTESRLSNEALVASNQRVVDLLEKTRELDAVKTEFFANISHELRTPLTLILLPLERVVASMAPQDPQRAELESAYRNAELLVTHVNNLLDAAKLEAGGIDLHYSETDMVQLIRLTAAFFESRAVDRDIDFKVITPGDLPAQVDPAQVRRVLLNLLANAFIFTPKAGTIRLELTRDGATLALGVADSGPGVPVEERERIFDRFQQGAARASQSTAGTGLGLSIVRDLVTLHGGSISVEDAPEGGALFTVSLPTEAPLDTTIGRPVPLPWSDVVIPPDVHGAHTSTATLAMPTAGVSGEAGADRPVVLVVEDNPELNELIAMTLRGHYEVVTAFDGREGLDLARKHHPAVIVADVMMPVLGGEELVGLARADPALATTAILVVSARADEAGRMKLLNAGANDYLVKPFNIAELKARVASLVALHEAEAALRGERVREVTEQLRSEETDRKLRETAHRADRALEINDHVIQGLSSAAYAIEREDLVTAARAIGTSLDAARKVISNLAPMERPLPASAAQAPIPVQGSSRELVGPIRVVIADDTAEIRLALRFMLEGLADVDIVGEATDGLEAVSLTSTLRPDLLLLDLSMPVMNGMEALPRIRSEVPDTKVVVNSGYGRDKAALDALSMGACAYLEKGGSTGRMATLIEDLFPGRSRTRQPRAAERPLVAGVPQQSSTEDDADLVSVYVHELRNPLAAATGIAEVLAEHATEGVGPGSIELTLSLIRSLRRMNRLVDSLTEANRIGAGNLSLAIEPVDLVALIQATINDAASTSGRAVDLEAPESVIAPVDPFRIRQVIENLLTNAAKFSPAGSAIEVRVDAGPSTVDVSVSDHGPGVPRDKQQLLFQKFQRLGSNVPGVGLGLYLSHEIAIAHNGDLTYEADPLTTFVLRLPRLDPRHG